MKFAPLLSNSSGKKYGLKTCQGYGAMFLVSKKKNS